jgi:hypothetical protein
MLFCVARWNWNVFKELPASIIPQRISELDQRLLKRNIIWRTHIVDRLNRSMNDILCFDRDYSASTILAPSEQRVKRVGKVHRATRTPLLALNCTDIAVVQSMAVAEIMLCISSSLHLLLKRKEREEEAKLHDDRSSETFCHL